MYGMRSYIGVVSVSEVNAIYAKHGAFGISTNSLLLCHDERHLCLTAERGKKTKSFMTNPKASLLVRRLHLEPDLLGAVWSNRRDFSVVGGLGVSAEEGHSEDPSAAGP